MIVVKHAEEDENVFHSKNSNFLLFLLVLGNTGLSNDNDDYTRPPFSDYPISIKSSSQHHNRLSAGNNMRNNTIKYSLEQENINRYSLGAAGSIGVDLVK